MKISILIIATFSLFSNAVHGQSNYIKFQSGYHFGLPTGNVRSTNIPFSGYSIDAHGTKKSLAGTLGGGALIELAYGRMFNKYIGVELGFNYLFGATELIGECTLI